MNLSLLLAPLATLAAPGAPLEFSLGPQGEILTFLVAGPYPNEGALELRGTGFRTDYLDGEASARPTEGTRNGAFAWKLALGDPRSGLDLNATLGNGQPAIGYVFVVLHAPKALQTHLLFGSDDGAKIWLNGRQLFEKQIARGIKRDEDRVVLDLEAGDNALLFKIEQGNGGWGLLPRLATPEGVGQRGVSVRLGPLLAQEERDPVLRKIRQIAPKGGQLDVHAVAEARREIDRARRWVERLRPHALDPEKLEQTLNASEQALKNAEASDATALSRTSVRVAQDVRRAYDRSRAPLLKRFQNPGPLLDVDPKKEDFILPMREGRYFQHPDGRPFIVLGYNHNPDWPELEQANPLAPDYDLSRTDRWFRRLAAHGVNVVRLMVETPPSGNLEEVPGTFRPEHVMWLDEVVLAARRHGVRLWITPYDTFWMSLRADASPYWKANGGPIDHVNDFLTKPEILKLQENRLKYLIDRYGNLGTVFCWEIMNEIDLWWNGTPEQIKAWTDRVGTFARNYQKQRWGIDHLFTISMAEPKPAGLNGETAFRRPDLNFATAHLYLGKSKALDRGEEAQAGRDFAEGVAHALGQITDRRPFLDGESGPIDRWVGPIAMDDELFYQMSWSHLLAGGAGSGMRWPYRNPHHLTDGMLQTLGFMAEFAREVDWRALAGEPVPLSTMAEGADIRVLSSAKQAIVWVQGARGRSVDFGPTRGEVRVFDPRMGTWFTPWRPLTGPVPLPRYEAVLVIRR